MNKSIFSIVVFVLFAMPLYADPSDGLAGEEGWHLEGGATVGREGETNDYPGPDLLRVDIDENRASIETNSTRISENQMAIEDLGNKTSENRQSIAIVATVVDETQQDLVTFGLAVAQGLEDINANLMMSQMQTMSLIQENAVAIQANAMRLGALGEQADKNTAGVAMALATANIPDIVEGKRFALGMGLGTFDGKTSAALGGSIRVSPRMSIRASLTSSEGEVGGGLGFGISF